MEGQLRLVRTQLGEIPYLLERKRVKNWNLRIRGERVILSAPARAGGEQADQVIRERAEWILRALARQGARRHLEPPDRASCASALGEAVERMLPLVAPLGVRRPRVKLRRMRSQWGNCHWKQGYITLNTALAACPEELRDYVALHELVHFLHPDHGSGFYAAMDALMPDWRERRRALRQYDPQPEPGLDRAGGQRLPPGAGHPDSHGAAPPPPFAENGVDKGAGTC